jgi:hypothetical protein
VEDEIIKVESNMLEGKYNPITPSGTILVNDILVSCYSHMEDHHAMHFMIQWLLNLFGLAHENFESEGVLGREDGLHTIAGTLYEFFRRYFIFHEEGKAN